MGPILSCAVGMLLSKGLAFCLPKYAQRMGESRTLERGKKNHRLV